RYANDALGAAKIDQELCDLYPYIIEPHGHVSRSCHKHEKARKVRSSKKADGVYYTPADVAHFIVREIASHNPDSGSWLDPACGTGVFLRAIIRHAKERSQIHAGTSLSFIQRYIYGIDKSALATECA